MVIIEKCYKYAIIPDHNNHRYEARITFIRRREPGKVTYFLMSGKQVSKHRCMKRIK